MPAAAVIPAPIAYIKVVAVKKLVVELRPLPPGPPIWACTGAVEAYLVVNGHALYWVWSRTMTFTLKKLECSKQAIALDTLAWDNIIGFRSYCVGLRDRSND